MERMICQCCGEALHKHGDGYECVYCGAHYRDDQAEKAAELLRSVLDGFKLEQLANARRRLYEVTHEKYPSSQAVTQAAGNVLSISPEDFMARVYLHSHDSDPHALISILAREHVSEWEAKETLAWLIPSLDPRTVGAVKDFADRHLQGEDKTKALNEIEDEAFKLDSGVYDTSFRRDVFLCYSAADMPRVLEVLELFEENGLSCFAAFRNLRHGKGAQENYQEAIFRAMKSCRVFVFLSSNSSRSPTRKGVAEELDHLISDLKKKPRVEYLLEDYPEHMPLLAKRRLAEAFPHLEHCRDEDDLVLRVSGLLNAEENAEKEKARKIAEEAITKAKQELQAEFEAMKAARKAELEVERLRLEKEKLELEKRRIEDAKGKGSSSFSRSALKVNQAEKRRNRGLAKEVEAKIAIISLEDFSVDSKAAIDAAKKAYDSLTEEQKTLVTNFQHLVDVEALYKKMEAIDAEFQMKMLPDGGVMVLEYVGIGKTTKIPNQYRGHQVTSIGESAFEGRSSLTSVAVPSSVTSIGKSAFRGCSSLESVVIPTSVTSIGESAFRDCSSLTSVAVPSSVTSIGKSAFRGCSSMASISIPSSVTSIGESTFEGCSSLTSVAVPSSVTSIGKSAFHGCSSLESVVIPSSVTSIGESALYGCTSLESVTIPFVGGSATANTHFDYVFGTASSRNGAVVPSGLESVVILEGCTSIGTLAFQGCSHLISIAIPESVTSIGDFAFQGCTRLASIAIPEGVTSVGESAFDGCSSLTYVAIPEGVASIGNATFSGCSSLASIAIPSSVVSIGDQAFRDCSSLTSAAIPEGVASIGNATFSGCSSLASITIPSSVVSIGDHAFLRCSSLPSITIPEGVTSIGVSAFRDCSSLPSISIPSSVTLIGKSAFYGCTSLESVTLPFVGESVSSNSFIGYLFGGSYATFPSWLKSATLLEGCPSIGEFAFQGCSSLESVVIPSSVTSIGESAFDGCSSLESVVIPSSVTSIGQSAFRGCSSLSSISIPSSVTFIGKYAFDGCLKDCTIHFGCKAPLFSYPEKFDPYFLVGFKGKTRWGGE